MTFRHPLALAVAAFLVFSSLSARPTILGVVVAADRVHLNTTAVTAGATVYDGDRFSTEAGGLLLVRIDTTMLELAEASAADLRNRANGAEGMEVELGKGTLVFSAARAVLVNVIALDASIRPVADTRTVAQITVTGPKELRIRARRGALQFSYRGETETIAEGESYSVVLDPSDDEAKKKGAVKAARVRKTFLLVAITGAAAGAATAAALHGNHGHKKMESPDRP